MGCLRQTETVMPIQQIGCQHGFSGATLDQWCSKQPAGSVGAGLQLQRTRLPASIQMGLPDVCDAQLRFLACCFNWVYEAQDRLKLSKTK
jgi:hypothetical protein